MSAWKLFVRDLYACAEPTDRFTLAAPSNATAEAQRMGLVRPVGRLAPTSCKSPVLWALTERGEAFCEGRLAQTKARQEPGRTGGRKWVATWLAALPGGVAIRPGPLQVAAGSEQSWGREIPRYGMRVPEA